MAMDIQKVNELEENNSVSKLVGMDSAGNLHSAMAASVMKNVMYESVSGKDLVNCFIYNGVAHISTSKGEVVCVHLINDTGILLGETQHYTTDQSEAENKKKILVNVSTGSGYITIQNYTGESLAIRVAALGFPDTWPQ